MAHRRAKKVSKGHNVDAAPWSALPVMESICIWDQCFPVTETCGSFEQHADGLAKRHRLGHGAVSITVAYDPEDTMTALSRLAKWRAHILAQPERYRLLQRAGDAKAARQAGQLAVGFHFQGSTPFGRDLALVEIFRRLGVHAAVLAYNMRNAAADGVHDTTDAGLSRFGRGLVVEMQRVGMAVDLSHTGLRSAKETLSIADAPVIYSHANAASVYPHPRNISDAMAKDVAATGGMVGTCGVSLFLGADLAPADLEDRLFAHLDHWITVLGPEHVGLGLDVVTDPVKTVSNLAAEAEKWPSDAGYQAGNAESVGPTVIHRLADRMASAGYGVDAIHGILGQNWARLFETLEQSAGGDT